MKKYLFFLLSVTFISSYAQVRYDTLATKLVNEGMLYSKIFAASVPWTVHILRIDISNQRFKVESVKAGDKLLGNEQTTSMAARNSFKSHKVIAAINGDFYLKGGIPTNLQIRNGQILTTPLNRSVIGFDSKNVPVIGIVKYEGKVFNGTSWFKLSGINKPRDLKKLILYNKFFGESTGTDSEGREILVQRINGWQTNDTVKCIVRKIAIGIGDMPIPDTTFAVLSAGDSARAFTKPIRIGDTIKIVNSISPTNLKIKEAIGGFIQLVKDGKNYVNESHNKENKPAMTHLRHPRTGIGISKDSTQLFLFIVDGRQSHSKGMTLPEFADLMIKSCVYQGINLDGGGSSTMVIQDSIMNIPSDGKERAVGNGLLIIMDDDTGQEVQSNSFIPLNDSDILRRIVRRELINKESGK